MKTRTLFSRVGLVVSLLAFLLVAPPAVYAQMVYSPGYRQVWNAGGNSGTRGAGEGYTFSMFANTNSGTNGAVYGKLFTEDGTTNGTPLALQVGQTFVIRMGGEDSGGRTGISSGGRIGFSLGVGTNIFSGGESALGRATNQSRLRVDYLDGSGTNAARLITDSVVQTGMPSFNSFKSGQFYAIEMISADEFIFRYGTNIAATNTVFNIAALGGTPGSEIGKIHVYNIGQNMGASYSNIVVSNSPYLNFSNTAGQTTSINGLVKDSAVAVNAAEKRGAGTIDLNAENTYTGGTTLREGTLRLGHDSAMGTGKLTVASAGALASTTDAIRTIGNSIDLFNDLTLGQSSGGTGSLNLAGNVFLGNSPGTRAITVNGTHEISGAITGTDRGIDKLGSGLLRLSGGNTFGGAINVNQGELRIEGNQSGATGAVTVASGAILSGSGTIGGATTINGIHNPGSSPGIQSFSADLTYNNGAAVNWELIGNTASGRGTNYDGIDLLGAANLNFAGLTTLNLHFNAAGSFVSWADIFWNADRDWLVYDLNDGIKQNFENLTINTENWLDSLGASFNETRSEAAFTLASVGQDVFLVYTVPEPSTWALLILGGGGLLAVRLRRRRNRVD